MQGKIVPAFDELGGSVQILPNMQERVNIDWLIKMNAFGRLVNMLFSIEEIQNEIDKLVSKIGYPPHSVTVFSVPTNDGTPYVSFENEMYNYISSERGCEFSRKTTKSIDELLYWIASDFVSNISFQYEFEHRMPGRDGRRMAFPMIIAFMASMNKEWEIKAQKEIDQTLSNAPYDDSLYL